MNLISIIHKPNKQTRIQPKLKHKDAAQAQNTLNALNQARFFLLLLKPPTRFLQYLKRFSQYRQRLAATKTNARLIKTV